MPAIRSNLPSASPVLANVQRTGVLQAGVQAARYFIHDRFGANSFLGRLIGNPAPPRMAAPGSGHANGPDSRSTWGRAEQLRCAETGRLHPALSRQGCLEIGPYFLFANQSLDPSSEEASYVINPGNSYRSGLDAFRAMVELPERPGAEAETVPLLPPMIRESSLLNAGLGLQPVEDGGEPVDWHGRLHHRIPNTLFDPATGFAASITLRRNNEVVIGFSGLGSQGGTRPQLLSCIANVLGLSPQRNFEQASVLTELLKSHLEGINAQTQADPPYKLTLSGYSMGGAIASYAALRNDVDAVVINPLRLGLMGRAQVGKEGMARAKQRLTELSLHGDWVSNSRGKGIFYAGVRAVARWLSGSQVDTSGALGNRFLMSRPVEQLRERARRADLTEREVEAYANQDFHGSPWRFMLSYERRLRDEEDASQADAQSGRSASADSA